MKRESATGLKILFFGCIVLSLLLIGIAKPANAAEPIRIGVVFSITGPGGFVGTPQRDGLMAVVDDVNKRGGILGRQLEIFVEDDKGNPTNAVIATTKLIKDKKVSVVIGPSMIDSGMAMIPICEQEQTPFVVTGPVVSPFKKWVFILGSGDARDAANFLKRSIQELGARRIAVLYDTSAYGSTAHKVFNGEIGKYPEASFVIQERCETTDTNMIPQLTKIKAANADTLIIYTSGNAATVTAKNLNQLGINMRILCAGGVAVPEFFKNAGAIAEERKFLYWELKAPVAGKFPADDPYRKNLYEPFKKILQAKFGTSKDVSLFHTLGYDGIQVAIEALKIAGTDDRAAVRDALEKVRFEGFIGPYACTPTDHIGALAAARTFLILKNGELWPFVK
jgi:branched-chain amino acid transport system substrate-binding protein